MAYGVNNNTNNFAYPQTIRFRGAPAVDAQQLINKPIEKVENVVNKTVDTFVKEPEDEKKKKSHKTAITAGSSVFVLTALIALLNPRFSGKFVDKLKTMASKAGAKAQTNKNSFVTSKIYRTGEKVLQNVADCFQFTNTINAGKDLGFKWICTAEKFKGVKNNTLRNILQKCDAGFIKVMSTAHNSITNAFDKISKHTVYQKYSGANKQMSSFEELASTYKDRLSLSEQKAFETKLTEIQQAKEFFSKNNTANRLQMQEKSMAHLESDFKNRFLNDFCKNFKKGDLSQNAKHIRNNMSYWAEDMLMPARNRFEENGKKAVDTLVGNGKDTKGKYNEIIDIISPHISKEEKAVLENSLNKTSKKLSKANKSECIEYFAKKRDLVLGGAPTDILTGIGMIGASGIAVGTADTKEDRISRALTLGFPAIAGVGTSLALTAMLYSGVQGMLLGSVAGFGFSKAGSIADNLVNKKPQEVTNA